MVPIAELKKLFHPKNRNKHPKDQLERLAKILTYQGARYAAKISKLSGYMTSGHGRVMAAEIAGWTEYPVDDQDYETEEQEYADLHADNAIASWSELDLSEINTDIGALGPEFDIDLLGIKNFKIDVAENQNDPESMPACTDTIAKPGDIWQLGRHRLMCGDSTNIEQITRLMAGEMADMIFTDPPYNIAYEGGSKKREMIKNDEVADFYQFLYDVYTCALMASKGGAPIYVTHADSERVNFTKAFLDAGFKLSSVIIWVKNNSTFGRQDYFWKHEPMLYGWNPAAGHKWYGPNTEDTVWEIDRPSRSAEHPTMKPIELVERALNNSSQADDAVLDLFGGSGTTLIACEKNQRRAYLMELDPKYVDVIIARWQEYTGLKAELLTPGQDGAA